MKKAHTHSFKINPLIVQLFHRHVLLRTIIQSIVMMYLLSEYALFEYKHAICYVLCYEDFGLSDFIR